MSDYKLSKDLKNGDEKAYIKAVSLYSDKLFAYALSLSGDHATADDLVQEVFIKLYEYRKKINPNYSLQSFLYKSLYHKFIDLYYKNKSRSKLHDSYLKLLDQIVNDTSIEEFEIKLKKIIANIEKLPSKTKEIFKLSKQSGLTNKEISKFLDISIKTVEFHITKSYKFLRTQI